MSQSIPLSDLARAPAVKFEKVGDKASGVILTARREQQRDFDTNKGKTWDNGDPMMQLVIVIDTDQGEKTLYARGGGRFDIAEGEGQPMEPAIATAARNAGAKSIDPGAELAVMHSGVAKPSKPGLNGQKLFVAQYKPPAPAGGVPVDLFNT